MEYRSIGDIYAANHNIHLKFSSAVSELTDEQANATPEGEKWSVAQIVEHVSMVEGGVCRICAKLLSSAEKAGQPSGEWTDMSAFMEKAESIGGVKLEAPEIVQPNAGRTIAESLEVMSEAGRVLETLREKFENFDGDTHKFPHPYFGDLSAKEWLALAGGHKIRHLRQIKRVLEKI